MVYTIAFIDATNLAITRREGADSEFVGCMSSSRKRKVCTYLWTWLMIPFPPSIGMTDVEFVLKDRTRPSEVKGEFGVGRWFW